MPEMTIREMQDRSHKTALEKGWWDRQQDQILGKMALIHSEVSEAVEEWRKPGEERALYYETKEDGSKKPCGIGVELADAIIRIGDLAGALGIDLTEMLEAKMEYNDTRSYRHGGKVA